jgi:hypothetical protein
MRNATSRQSTLQAGILATLAMAGTVLSGEPDGPPLTELTLTGRYTGSEAPRKGAEFSYGVVGLSAQVPLFALGDYHFGIDPGYERLQFGFKDFSKFTGFAKNPLSGANAASVTPNVAYTWSDDLTFIAGFTAHYSASDGAVTGDSMTYGGFLTSAIKLSDSLSLGLGIAYMERLERSALFLPFPGIDWRISEHWRLAALRAAHPRVIYSPGVAWHWFFEAGYEYRDIRLERSAAPGSGIVRLRSTPVALGAEVDLSGGVSLTVEAGAAISEHFQLANAHGDTVADGSQKTVPFGQAALRVRF